MVVGWFWLMIRYMFIVCCWLLVGCLVLREYGCFEWLVMILFYTRLVCLSLHVGLWMLFG